MRNVSSNYHLITALKHIKIQLIVIHCLAVKMVVQAELRQLIHWIHTVLYLDQPVQPSLNCLFKVVSNSTRANNRGFEPGGMLVIMIKYHKPCYSLFYAVFFQIKAKFRSE